MLRYAHAAAARSRACAARCWRDLGIPEEVLEHIELTPQLRHARRRSARSRARASRCRALETYAERLWDYWERNLDPDLFKDRSLRGRRQRQDRDDHRRLVRHRPGGRAEDRRGRRRSRCWSRARRRSSRRSSAEIEAAGGTAYVYSRRPLRHATRSTRSSSGCSPTTPRVDMLVNNAGPLDPPLGRALLRPLPRLRAHDPAQLLRRGQADHRAAAAHARAQLRPHRQRLLDRRADQPAALLAPTSPRRPRSTRSRASVASETIGDGVTFTTIHMPLVRTPMIAPTKIYDSFPTITPDEAADLICEAMRAQPKQINTRLGHVRRGRLRARAEGGRPDPAHGLQGVPGSRPPAASRRTGEREGVGRGDRARAPDARRALVTAQRVVDALAARAARSAGAGRSNGRCEPTQPDAVAAPRRS